MEPVTIIILIAMAAAGGAGIYGFVESVTRSDGPNLSNSTISSLEYDARSKNAIIDFDFDFRQSGIIMEIGIVSIIGVLGFLCCCFQCCKRDARMRHSMCYDDEDENRWRSKRVAKREKHRNKRILEHRRKMVKRQARMEMIQEIEELNHKREIKEHDDTQAKKLAKVHKLRPTSMVRPIRMRVNLLRVEDIEDPTKEIELEDTEASLSELMSESDFSDFTVNLVSECSYVYIE